MAAKSGAERVREHREKKKGLEEARALGRKYGEDEARRLLECGSPRIADADPRVQARNVEERVQRAIRYAEWNWTENGKIA